MKHTSAWPAWLGYGYIILPIFIFVIGFCNVFTALAGTGLILISAYFLYKNSPKLWVPATQKEKWLVLLAALVSLYWVYSSGIGALVFQNSDHSARNAIFELLVTQPWPVLIKGKVMLSY